MKKISLAILVSLLTLVGGCAVKNPVTNQYKLAAFSRQSYQHQPHSAVSLLISQPEAVGGYQTEQMYYVKTPFELNAFVHNAWVSTPASMLFPLLVQSLQQTNYFYAVATTPYADKADYRLDTQLIELQQEFLTKPSKLQFVAKIVLTHIDDARVVASHIIRLSIPCPKDAPYGGVVAANQATYQFTKITTEFVIRNIQRDFVKHRAATIAKITK